MLPYYCAAGGGRCVGSNSPKPNPVTGQNLVNPSGNWCQEFADANGNTFLRSALLRSDRRDSDRQRFSEVGTPFNSQCEAQRDITLSNGIVQNVHQFTGTLTGNLGVLRAGMVAIVPTTAFQSEPLPIGKSSLLTIRLGPISARTTQSDHRFLQIAEIV